jgi:hypothetical protein
VRFDEVQEPVLYGHDIDAALEFVSGFQATSSALAGMSRDDAARAVDRYARPSRAITETPRVWPLIRAPG